MAWLVEQFSSDRGVQLGAEEIIRPFGFGTNWQTIRIGFRVAVNGYSTLAATGPYFGICTGSSGATYQSAVDALYWYPWYTTAGGAAYGGTWPIVYRANTVNFPYNNLQRVGTSTGNVGAVTISRAALSANPESLRTIFMIEYSKGAIGAAAMGGITMWYMPATGSGILRDWSRGDFLAAMEVVSPPLMSGGSAPATLPLRTAKDWDSTFVSWSYTTPTVCLFDMAVTRFT